MSSNPDPPPVLSVEGMQRYLNKRDLIVKFYAPWCGHCKKMDSAYADVARSLKAEIGGDVAAVKFNADAHRSALSTLDAYGPLSDVVVGYPTIAFFRAGGKASVYQGERTSKGILQAAKGFFADA